MKLRAKWLIAGSLVALFCAGSPSGQAGESPRIPGAGGSGGSSSHENVIEGTMEKYDSVLNKLTIKGIEEDRMTLDTIKSLTAKEGTRRMPMAMVKPGQKIRVIYTEKGNKKLAKDVEVVREDSEGEPDKKKNKGKAKEDKDEPTIPGSK